MLYALQVQLGGAWVYVIGGDGLVRLYASRGKAEKAALIFRARAVLFH